MATLIVRPSAQLDIDEALSWYYQRDPTVAQRLFAELDVVFERIRQNPGQFPVVVEPIQRALLRKFPYSVYFIVGGDLAAVVAVIHQRRKPNQLEPARRGWLTHVAPAERGLADFTVRSAAAGAQFSTARAGLR